MRQEKQCLNDKHIEKTSIFGQSFFFWDEPVPSPFKYNAPCLYVTLCHYYDVLIKYFLPELQSRGTKVRRLRSVSRSSLRKRRMNLCRKADLDCGLESGSLLTKSEKKIKRTQTLGIDLFGTISVKRHSFLCV